MNDFTKKELMALEDAMQNMFDLNPPSSGESPLLNKLQSMIDNYCDHDPRNTKGQLEFIVQSVAICKLQECATQGQMMINDFTKKELEDIYYDLNKDKNPMRCGETILNKIQSMIDGYCEHEFEIKSFCPHLLIMCARCCKTFVDDSFPG